MHYSYLSCMRYYVCAILIPLYALREAPVWLNQMAHCHNKNEVIIYQQNLLFTLINLSPNVPEVVS